MGRVTQGRGAQNKKDIGDDDGLLLLDGAERVLLLVLPRVQPIVPQLWKTKRGTGEGEEGCSHLSGLKKKNQKLQKLFLFFPPGN